MSLHYISPSTNPLHIVPIGQGQYSNGQSFPANAKRNTTRVRKRPMKGNSVVPDMSRVMLGKGKQVNTSGSEVLVTWGVHSIVRPFSRTQKTFTDGLRSPCRRFPSLISRWSCQKWPHLLSRTEQYRVVLKKETRTRRQQVVGGVRFTSPERIIHAGKFRRDVHQKTGQS